MPAISIIATPGKRRVIVAAAQEAERRGFTGVYCPSFGDALGTCLSIAHSTTTLRVGTAIQPIYFQRPHQLATQAAHLHELSDGRFTLGIGVSHDAVLDRYQIDRSTPMSDMRAYVEDLRRSEKASGPLPPIVLATLRQKMLEFAVGSAEGAVWANAARSAMAAQLSCIPVERRESFFVGNMIPTVIDSDRNAAAAVCRKTLITYVSLPNYRNYWHDNGFAEEMDVIASAVANGERGEALTAYMPEHWLREVVLYGTASEVLDGLDAWFDAGVTTPILVPSSTSGGQAKAVAELFAAFD